MDHTGGCTKQYRCSYDTYLPYCLSLELSVIIYLAFDATVHNKDYANVINDIDKLIFKLSIAEILDPELIHDDPIFYKYVQVHETEGDQYVILAT